MTKAKKKTSVKKKNLPAYEWKSFTDEPEIGYEFPAIEVGGHRLFRFKKLDGYTLENIKTSMYWVAQGLKDAGIDVHAIATAGGYLRDLLLHNRPKDMDIFVIVPDDQMKAAQVAVDKTIENMDKAKASSKWSCDKKYAHVSSKLSAKQYKSKKKRKVPYNIILMGASDTPDVGTMLANFDFAINQFAYFYEPGRDKSYSVAAAQAIRDLRWNTATAITKNKDHIKSRWEHLSPKLKGFDLVIP